MNSGKCINLSSIIVLKNRDINTLSEREYQYFINKDDACNKFIANSNLTNASDSLAKEDIKIKRELAKSEKGKNGAVAVVMILLSAVLGRVIGSAIGGLL